MTKKTIPAISIVIPMYNAEKYVGECLDSILAQTFQDFEVIVVDNCSTDNSVAIVENYLKNWKEGAIQLVRRKSNSGNAAVPRNTGLKHSTGEFLFFMDSDDAITPNALEELYKVAKNFDADIVYSDKYYHATQDKIINDLNSVRICIGVNCNQGAEIKNIHENFSERIEAFGTAKMSTFPWSYLFRRKMVMENNVKFPEILHGEDEVFDFHSLCAAKKIVYTPNAFYIYRIRQDSMLHQRLSVEKEIQNWYSSIFKAIGILDEIMSKFKFFEENPEYKYLIFDSFTRKNLPYAPQIYSQIHPGKLDKLLRRELEPVKDKTALAAFLFSRMNIFQVNILQQQNIIRQLQAQIQQLKQNPYSL